MNEPAGRSIFTVRLTEAILIALCTSLFTASLTAWIVMYELAPVVRTGDFLLQSFERLRDEVARRP